MACPFLCVLSSGTIRDDKIGHAIGKAETYVDFEQEPDSKGKYCCNALVDTSTCTSDAEATKTTTSKEKISSSSSILQPEQRQESQKNRTIECEQCGELYPTLFRLKGHLWNCIAPNEKPFCEACGSTFASSGSLRRHLLLHKFRTNKECVPAAVCRKRLQRSNILKKQPRNRSDRTPFSCPICEKQFFRPDYFQQHVMFHTGEKPHCCPHCSKCFRERKKLRIHLMRAHDAGKLQFSCDVCSKRFAASGDLFKHSRIHTKEKPYQCNVCGNTFGFASNLRRHLRSHLVEKPYQCYLCDKKFAHNWVLTVHLRSHVESFSCEACGRRSSTIVKLRTHIQRHLWRKVFQCEVCNSAFCDKISLRDHYCNHTGVQPYHCRTCGQGFNNRNGKLFHERKHRLPAF